MQKEFKTIFKFNGMNALGQKKKEMLLMLLCELMRG